jgi:hypothetical protein
MSNNETPELITITEAARRIGACAPTLKRRVAKANLAPDAILVEGSREVRMALFAASRIPELCNLIFPANE